MGMTPEQRAVMDLAEQGYSNAEIAKALGLTVGIVQKRKARAKKWVEADPAVAAMASAAGVSDPSVVAHGWKIARDDEGNGYSIFLRNPDTGQNLSLSEMISGAVDDAAHKAPEYEMRPEATGKYLLVIDLADVHFLKLCVESETGYAYRRDVAFARVVEGTKALLRSASGFGVGRVLFVLGNDILHFDNPKRTTTSGTPQDGDGSLFQGFSDAFAALTSAIEECAKVADVDLVHVMSNHDWLTGWTLSQAIAAHFSKHPHVHSTPYTMSERHRKYYRFGGNLFGLTHGDGAKEEKLYGLMVSEARQHIGECRNLYWLCHHVHHKIRNRRGVDVFQSEKDHNGMTVVSTGSHAPEGQGVQIEYVRSPSAPDGWHDRNGYVSRQGVECFLYHPSDGMKARFTEWF